MTHDAIRTALLDSLRMNGSFVLVVLAYIVAAVILGHLVGFDTTLSLYNQNWLIFSFATFWLVLVPYVLVKLYRYRPPRPTRFVRNILVYDLRIVERVIIALPCILLFPIFSSAFTSVKSAIGFMHPYRLDPLFAHVDSMLHGGHAWELIHLLVGFPMVTLVLNIFYNIWFFVVWIVFALVTVLTTDRALREQYLLAFCGCWILLGSVGAVAFSSVGPCFYALFYSTDPYAPLMDYLRSANQLYPIWALTTQDLLWNGYESGSPGVGRGISAMPSLHVAVTTLNALLLSKLSRTAAVLGWIYLVLILVGSVHLGWHYAIDGYVSVVGVLLIWRAAGLWVGRSTRTEPVPVASC